MNQLLLLRTELKIKVVHLTCSKLSTTLNNIVTLDSASTLFLHAVDNYEQCGQYSTLFHPVILQAHNFFGCVSCHIKPKNWIYHIGQL